MLSHLDSDWRMAMEASRLGLRVILTLALVAAPLAAGAQPAGKVYRVGYLTAAGGVEEAFRQALRGLGYVEGQNLVIEGRFAQRKLDRLSELAADLVRLNVDVIVTITTPAALAAKKATTTIPIVLGGIARPVELGLVKSLARPGGNVTGVTNNPGDGFTAKQHQLLRETAPGVSRVGWIWNPDIAPEAISFREMQAAAPALGITILSAEVRQAGEFAGAAAKLTQEGADALYVLPSSLNYSIMKQILDFAAAHRLPSMFSGREFVDAGGLISYWVNWPDVRRRAAVFVDKILKGARPAELPVEDPTRFEMVINMKTAKALGLTIPQSLLLRADEVIE
jgi:putative ABC transport system substrate-binding protein